VTELLEPSHHKSLEKGATPPSSFSSHGFFPTISSPRFNWHPQSVCWCVCGSRSSAENLLVRGTLIQTQHRNPRNISRWSALVPGTCNSRVTPPIWHVLRGLYSPDESREHKLHDMSDGGFKMRGTAAAKCTLVKLADSDSFL
jgi:hypothetical protein